MNKKYTQTQINIEKHKGLQWCNDRILSFQTELNKITNNINEFEKNAYILKKKHWFDKNPVKINFLDEFPKISTKSSSYWLDLWVAELAYDSGAWGKHLYDALDFAKDIKFITKQINRCYKLKKAFIHSDKNVLLSLSDLNFLTSKNLYID